MFRSVLLAFLLSPLCYGQTADLVLMHGKLFGSDAQALAVRADRIVAIGSDDSISNMIGPATLVYDLAGRAVLPGFNDAHCHWMPRPSGSEVQLSGMDPAWSEVIAAVKNIAARSPKGTWIYANVGARVINDHAPDRTSLDGIAPQHPVWVSVWSGHGLILNTAAMRKLGLGDEEPDTADLHYQRFSGTRRLSGRFAEYEHWVQNRRLASLATEQEKLQSLREMADTAVRFGVTSLQAMPTTPTEEFAALLRQAHLPVRVRAIDYTLPGSKSWVSDEVHSPNQDIYSKVRVSGLKWVLDGTPVERGAALRNAYADKPDWTGTLDLSPDKLRSVVQRAWRSSDQTLFHVVGDRATAELFKVMLSTGPAAGWKPKRIRIEHGEGIAPDLLSQAIKLGVVVVQNPTHFSIRDVTAARFGEAAKVQPFRSLAEAGVPIAIGSDGPMNPYLNIMFATTHPDNPAEAITREQAIAVYTRGSAYAEFAEKQKGGLVTGQLADFTVPSDDILRVPTEALPGLHSVLTVIGGQVVYDEGSVKHSKIQP